MPNPSVFMTDPALLTEPDYANYGSLMNRDVLNKVLLSTAAQDSKTAVMYYNLVQTLGENKYFAVPSFPPDDRDVVDDIAFWKELVKSGKIDLLLAPCSCTDYSKHDENATEAQVDNVHYLARRIEGKTGGVKVNLPVMKFAKNKTTLMCPACGLKVSSASPAEALLAYNRKIVEAAPSEGTGTDVLNTALATKEQLPEKIAWHLGKTVSVEQYLKKQKNSPLNEKAKKLRALQTRLRSLVLYCFDQLKITPRWDRHNVVVLYKEAGELYAVEVQHDVKTGTQYFAVFKNPSPSDYVFLAFNKEIAMAMVQALEPEKLNLIDGNAVLYYTSHDVGRAMDDQRAWSKAVDIGAGTKARLIPSEPKLATVVA